MKKLAAMMLALLMVLASVGIAEEVPFSEWLAGQDPVVTDVFAGEAPAPEVPTPEAPAPEAPGFEPIGVGSRGETVAQLQAKLIELGILDSKADGVFGPASEAAVKYTQKALGWEETGTIQTADELNTILALVPGDGVNLAVGTSDEWSEWMAPEYNQENKGFTFAQANIGNKQVGDYYTFQIEIEFSGVTGTLGEPFRFLSYGKVDNAWEIGNIWGRVVYLEEAPTDGVYKIIGTRRISEENVSATWFNIGLLCDYWASGSFRVRGIKVEKGITASAWSLAEQDKGDGINLARGASSEWSDWMMPEYDQENRGFTFAQAIIGNKQVGDAYTFQIEVEFSGVSATEGETFRFLSYGKVDDGWEKRNIWGRVVYMEEVPSDGVYKLIGTRRITEENVDALTFNIGLLCDYWASGSFRVRNIKVEKGITATEWTAPVQ